jgi:hypothetical protein
MSTTPIAPGVLLVAPADAGPRASDVLWVFDRDPDDPGALYALVFNQATEQPARPTAFALPAGDDDRLCWGGPTADPFALVELHQAAVARHRLLSESEELRPFVTARTAVFLPGRDHPPEAEEVARLRILRGSVWLDAHQCELYAREGFLVPASGGAIFYDDPATLADRLRAQAPDDV